jgi:Domain of unknown function (DUF4159)
MENGRWKRAVRLFWRTSIRQPLFSSLRSLHLCGLSAILNGMEPNRYALIGFFLICILFSRECLAATPEQIQSAIDNAKAYIYGEQNHGNWERQQKRPTDAEIHASEGPSTTGGQWGGLTALATYALLAGGDSPSDPRLAGAIKFLHDADIAGVYALGCKTQMYQFLPQSTQTRHDAQNDAKKLQKAMITGGEAAGLYDYLLDSTRTNRVDHSVSQYGVLGMWACERAGAEVPSKYWQAVETAWKRDQDASGGWAYHATGEAGHPISASMTAAGTATLFITQDYLHMDNGVQCKGTAPTPAIDNGLKWMAANFDKLLNDDAERHGPYYTLYGVERIGVASGLKYFGTVDWFDHGADYLVENQRRNGNWTGGLPNTCFALLFLSRGRAPVVFNKLQYTINSKPANWNQRPRDVANFVHWMSRETERDLNWQIVNLSGESRDLHDAPVLYIAGSEALHFTADEENKLRQFCEDGGLILGQADCGSFAFANTFRKLGSTLFHSYEFRELPAGSPIYTNEQYLRSKWKSHPSVMALSNGVRELMVLLPNGDPAKFWQLQEVSGHEEDFQLADNIFLYAVDKQNLLVKGKRYVMTVDPKITTDRSITVARLQYESNWDPEPGGWRRLAAILHNQNHVDLKTPTVKLGSGELEKTAKIAHLTGTARFQLTAAERDELKHFVQNGGMLIIDAAGGSSEFATSAEAELAAIFPDAAKQLGDPLPASDPLFNLAGLKITKFDYRPYARQMIGTVTGPRVKAIAVDHHLAVYYSREDLSAGLVGEPMDGIIGYDPATATAIVRNMVMSR